MPISNARAKAGPHSVTIAPWSADLQGLRCPCGRPAELLSGDYAMCGPCYDEMVEAVTTGRRIVGDDVHTLSAGPMRVTADVTRATS